MSRMSEVASRKSQSSEHTFRGLCSPRRPQLGEHGAWSCACEGAWPVSGVSAWPCPRLRCVSSAVFAAAPSCALVCPSCRALAGEVSFGHCQGVDPAGGICRRR